MMTKILAGAGVIMVALVAAAAGWWFLIREDAHPATSAPEIPQDLVQATASTSPGASQVSGTTNGFLTFRVNADRSEAAYFVSEELASVGLPSTAKGTTNEVAGQFSLKVDGTTIAVTGDSQLTVDLRNLTSDKTMRDRRVQEALQTSTFPTAIFTISNVTGYNASIPDGEEQTMQLGGALKLHGVAKQVTWDVRARRQGNVISVLATLTVSFADFNITPPRFAGLVSIDDKATLQIQLIAEGVSA